MLSTDEKKFGFIEIGEKENRSCVNDNGQLFILNWPIHRLNDFFTYRKCAICEQYYKVLEPIPDNLYFMGKVPTNQHREAD